MKKLAILSSFTLALVYGFTTIQQPDNCDKKAITASLKKALDPFKYDSQKITKINFTKKAQQMEVEVPVFVGEKYRVVLNTSGLPKPINISIYTKDKESKKREAIYTNKDLKNGETEIVFDAPRIRKMFIDYDIPADSTASPANKISGCVAFMVGYK